MSNRQESFRELDNKVKQCRENISNETRFWKTIGFTIQTFVQVDIFDEKSSNNNNRTNNGESNINNSNILIVSIGPNISHEMK